MSVTAVAATEPSAWIRSCVLLGAEATKDVKGIGLDSENGPRTITGEPGSRAERSWCRCDSCMPIGAVLRHIVTFFAPRVSLAHRRCAGCPKREVAPA